MSQHGQRLIVERDDARLTGFRVLSVYGKRRRFEINVSPSERGKFAPSNSSIQTKQDHRPEMVREISLGEFRLRPISAFLTPPVARCAGFFHLVLSANKGISEPLLFVVTQISNHTRTICLRIPAKPITDSM